jgi:hypothetical protein
VKTPFILFAPLHLLFVEKVLRLCDTNSRKAINLTVVEAIHELPLPDDLDRSKIDAN